MTRFQHVRAAYYRAHFCAAIADNQGFFARTTRIGQGLDINIFQRPYEDKLFDAGVALIAEHIRGSTGGDRASTRTEHEASVA